MTSASLRDVRIHRMDLPDHTCPWGLRAIRLLQEQHIPFEDHPLRSKAEVETFKVEQGVATTPQLFTGAAATPTWPPGWGCGRKRKRSRTHPYWPCSPPRP